MARPIAETPILYGEDAERFMYNMRHVKKISQEVLLFNSKNSTHALCKTN